MDRSQIPLGRTDIASAGAMEEFGAGLVPFVGRGSVIALRGELGAGKSTLARGLISAALAAAGFPPEEVPSPTYTLVQQYPFPSDDDPERAIWHFDLWRLEDPSEIHELGLDEALGRHVSVIEWPERIAGLLPGHALIVDIGIDADDPGRRLVDVAEQSNRDPV